MKERCCHFDLQNACKLAEISGIDFDSYPEPEEKDFQDLSELETETRAETNPESEDENYEPETEPGGR